MVLSEYRNIYAQCADAVLPEWKEMTKSQLCNQYLSETNEAVKNGIVAAIVCKCWNIFIHNFRNQPYIPIEDWYESMLESIMYVLDKHVWTNPKNVLYGNENGPEMALHRCIWSRKLNVYYSYNRPKHVANRNAYSLEQMQENGTDFGYVIEEDKYIFIDYIKLMFQKGRECFALLLDLIYNGTTRNKLVQAINKLPDDYYIQFAEKYCVDRFRVKQLIDGLKSKKDLEDFIEYYLTCLQRDEDLLEYLNN